MSSQKCHQKCVDIYVATSMLYCTRIRLLYFFLLFSVNHPVKLACVCIHIWFLMTDPGMYPLRWSLVSCDFRLVAPHYEETPVVIDIGERFTKLGFQGESVPRYVISTKLVHGNPSVAIPDATDMLLQVMILMCLIDVICFFVIYLFFCSGNACWSANGGTSGVILIKKIKNTS